MFRSKLLLKIGFMQSEIMNLSETTIRDVLRRYQFLLTANSWDAYDSKKFSEKGKEEYAMLIKNINTINEKLDIVNRALSKFSYFCKFKQAKINTKGIKKTFVSFYKFDIKSSSDIRKLKGELNSFKFSRFLNNLFERVLHDMEKFIDTFKEETIKFEIEKVDEKFHDDLYEVIDLYFFNYKRTSLLALGRILEGLINTYFKKLIEMKKIKFSEKELNNPKFNPNKIEYSSQLDRLKKRSLISERDYLILSKLKIDRNIGGHPTSNINKVISEGESEPTIKLGIKTLDRIDKKIKLLQKR